MIKKCFLSFLTLTRPQLFRQSTWNFHQLRSQQSLAADKKWLLEYLNGDLGLFTDLKYDQQKDVIRLELRTCRETGKAAPPVEFVETNNRWNEIIEIHSQQRRERFYKYLCVLWKRSEEKIEKKKRIGERMKLNVKRRDEMKKLNIPLTNYPGYHTPFRQYSKNYLKLQHRSYFCSLVNQFIYDSNNIDIIAFDFSFQEHMRRQDIRNCIDQLLFVYGENWKRNDPLLIYFTNMKKNGDYYKEFLRRNILLDDLLLFHSEKSYLELFPINRLVYLSPDSRQIISTVNSSIYIIGALVDKLANKKLTRTKARKEDINCERLPIDFHVKWGVGSKHLCLDQVFNIIVDQQENQLNRSLMKNDENHSQFISRCWKESFNKRLPKRKLIEASERRVNPHKKNSPYQSTDFF
ncbi:hypothetical protein SNEBB_000841 [Seison nebaliae]|nr:hypothetical protein SNEBB_000841 [Seison nebaliae]